MMGMLKSLSDEVWKKYENQFQIKVSDSKIIFAVVTV